MLRLERGKELDLLRLVSSQLQVDFEKTGPVESEVGAGYTHFAVDRKAGCSRSTAGHKPGCIDCKPAARTEGRHHRIAVVDCSAGRIVGRDHIPRTVGTADQVERTEHPAGKYWRLE